MKEKKIKRLHFSDEGVVKATEENPITRFYKNGEMAQVEWFRYMNMEYNGEYKCRECEGTGNYPAIPTYKGDIQPAVLLTDCPTCQGKGYTIPDKTEVETDKHIFYSNGDVFSKKHKMFLKHQTNTNSYQYVCFYEKGGVKKKKSIHRIVAENFIPNPENKKFVNHRDGDKTNNDISNLEWVTSNENMQHAWDNDIVSRKTKSGEKFIKNIGDNFMVRIKDKSIGTFKTMTEAIASRDTYLAYFNDDLGKPLTLQMVLRLLEEKGEYAICSDGVIVKSDSNWSNFGYETKLDLTKDPKDWGDEVLTALIDIVK